jgi:hypothetical protein
MRRKAKTPKQPAAVEGDDPRFIAVIDALAAEPRFAAVIDAYAAGKKERGRKFGVTNHRLAQNLLPPRAGNSRAADASEAWFAR